MYSQSRTDREFCNAPRKELMLPRFCRVPKENQPNTKSNNKSNPWGFHGQCGKETYCCDNTSDKKPKHSFHDNQNLHFKK